MAVVSDNVKMEQEDAEWAEALALRILLSRVRPERHAEATERIQAVVRDLEGPRRTGIRQLPRMSRTSRRRVKGLG
jgi:hypothetical protein